jgi:putative colanic acid biosynthesis UDP-glucose lipid carrier transferase
VYAVSGIWLLTCSLVLLGIFFTKTGSDFSRIWLATWFVLTYLELIFIRLALSIGLRFIRFHQYNLKRVGLIGSGPLASEINEKITANRSSGFLLTHHLDADDFSAIGSLAKIHLDEIWIALPIDETSTLTPILKALNNSSASIKFIPDMFTFRLINHGMSEVLGMPMLNLTSSPFVGSNLLIKTIEDLFLSALILVFISPIMILIAIGVKLTSPGPVFYRQKRVGLNGKSFMMLKFRSMPVDTEKTGAVWGSSNSKVVHPFSTYIRKYNLDELPQFFNVLLGQMSIVGPRPERAEFIQGFQDEIPNYMKKHLVKAGITGWAQVHGLRGDTDLVRRIEFDLFYIEHWSIWLDLRIIAMTIVETILPNKKDGHVGAKKSS